MQEEEAEEEAEEANNRGTTSDKEKNRYNQSTTKGRRPSHRVILPRSSPGTNDYMSQSVTTSGETINSNTSEGLHGRDT
eukprot:6098380-Amphidinium_carterae.1